MAEVNSSPRTLPDQVLPSALYPVEKWCGLPIVTHSGVAVGTIITASVVEDLHGGSTLAMSALTGAGDEFKFECGLGSAEGDPYV